MDRMDETKGAAGSAVRVWLALLLVALLLAMMGGDVMAGLWYLIGGE